MEEIKARLEMWDEEMFSLKWLEADSIYQALNPNFIKEMKVQKLPLQNKGKGVPEEE